MDGNTAQDIILDGAADEYRYRQTHEEKQSGLSIGVENSILSVAENLRSTVRTAQDRDNKTLQTLELYGITV